MENKESRRFVSIVIFGVLMFFLGAPILLFADIMVGGAIAAAAFALGGLVAMQSPIAGGIVGVLVGVLLLALLGWVNFWLVRALWRVCVPPAE